MRFFTVRPCKQASISTAVFIIFERSVIGTTKHAYLHLAASAQHCTLHPCLPVAAVPGHYCMKSHYVDAPQLISPFHCQWSFGLILIFGYFELGCCEYSCALLFTARILSGILLELKCSVVGCICVQLWLSLTLSTKVDTLTYTSVCDTPAVSHSDRHWVSLIFNFRQCGGCLKSSTVVICIFITTNVVVYLFILLLAIEYPLL